MDGMKRLIDQIRKHKTVVIVASLAIVLIIVIVIALSSKRENGIISQEGEWTKEQLNDLNNNDQFAFTDRRQFDNSVGSDNSAIVYENLKDFILSDAEKKTAPHKNQPGKRLPAKYYTGSLSGFAFVHRTSIDARPMQALQFSLDITDGRQYSVHVAFDNLTTARESTPIGQNYIAVLLKHTDGKNSQPVLYINRANNERDDDIWAWLSAIGFDRNDVDARDMPLKRYQHDSNGKFRVVSGKIPAGFSARETSSGLVTISNENMPKTVDGLSPLKAGDKVRLHYACPANGQSASSPCLVYKYDLYD
jgi:hypothetical protein